MAGGEADPWSRTGFTQGQYLSTVRAFPHLSQSCHLSLPFLKMALKEGGWYTESLPKAVFPD